MMRGRKKLLRYLIVIIPVLYIAGWMIHYAETVETDHKDTRILISEVVADNVSGLTDENGERSDWIELYNATDEDIDLGNYSIGENKKVARSYQLPHIILKAGSYQILYADGGDYVSGDRIHLDFSLDKSGDTLYLFSEQGEIVDHLKYPALSVDRAFGRSFFNSEDMGEFAFATPDRNNPDTFIAKQKKGNIGAICFSREGGNYNEEFYLELSSLNEDAIILYTLDGSEPAPRNGFIYHEPIRIGATENVENQYVTERCIPDTSENPGFSNYLYEYGTNHVYKGTVVRARLYEEGVLSETIRTESFFIDADYTLPIVSVSADPEDLFGNKNGIYVCGSVYYAGSKMNADRGALGNFSIDRSIDGHIEIWDADNSRSIFESDVKLEMGGSFSRQYNLQKAFKVNIEGDEIQFPVFSDESKEYSYNSFFLKSAGGGEALRGSFQKHLLNNMMIPLEIGTKIEEFCVLFVDGEYWGIYSLVEPKSEEYYEQHYGVPDIEYAQNCQLGSSEAFVEELSELVQIINNSDFTDENQYEWLKSVVDIDNFITFVASDIYIGNFDCMIGLDHNLLIWRSKEVNPDNDYADGRLRWTPIDMDSTLFADGCSKMTLEYILNTEATNIKWYRISVILFQKLWKRPEFRNDVAKEVYRLSDTVFSEELITELYNRHYQQLVNEMEENLSRLELVPNQFMKRFIEILDKIEPISNLTYDEWKDNMRVMESRLLGQKDVLETGLAEYTSLEVDSEKQVLLDNSFDYYSLFSKGFGNAVMTEDESYVWTTGEMSEFHFIYEGSLNSEEGLCMIINCFTLQSEERADIYLNGNFLGEHIFTAGDNKIYLPASDLDSGYGCLQLQFKGSTSPKLLGIGEDETILALRICGLSIGKADDKYFKVDGSMTLDIGEEAQLFCRGFSQPYIDGDTAYVWTYGYDSDMEFLLNRPMTMHMETFPISENQTVMVYINHRFAGEYHLEDNQLEIWLEEEDVKNGLVHIRMAYPEAVSPKQLGMGEDEAILSFRIAELSFKE